MHRLKSLFADLICLFACLLFIEPGIAGNAAESDLVCYAAEYPVPINHRVSHLISSHKGTCYIPYAAADYSSGGNHSQYAIALNALKGIFKKQPSGDEQFLSFSKQINKHREQLRTLIEPSGRQVIVVEHYLINTPEETLLIMPDVYRDSSSAVNVIAPLIEQASELLGVTGEQSGSYVMTVFIEDYRPELSPLDLRDRLKGRKPKVVTLNKTRPLRVQKDRERIQAAVRKKAEQQDGHYQNQKLLAALSSITARSQLESAAQWLYIPVWQGLLSSLPGIQFFPATTPKQAGKVVKPASRPVSQTGNALVVGRTNYCSPDLVTKADTLETSGYKVPGGTVYRQDSAFSEEFMDPVAAEETDESGIVSEQLSFSSSVKWSGRVPSETSSSRFANSHLLSGWAVSRQSSLDSGLVLTGDELLAASGHKGLVVHTEAEESESVPVEEPLVSFEQLTLNDSGDGDEQESEFKEEETLVTENSQRLHMEPALSASVPYWSEDNAGVVISSARSYSLCPKQLGEGVLFVTGDEPFNDNSKDDPTLDMDEFYSSNPEPQEDSVTVTAPVDAAAGYILKTEPRNEKEQ